MESGNADKESAPPTRQHGGAEKRRTELTVYLQFVIPLLETNQQGREW